MKKIVLLSFAFASIYANAQKVNLEVGKAFKVTSTIVNTSEMMGNESTSTTVTTTALKINSLEKDTYKGTSTLSKMTISGSMMGQDLSFDSDKKEDMDGQIGQMFGKGINKTTDFTIDKNTGAYATIKKDDEEENPMMAMMGGGANKNENSIVNVNFIGKKVGDKWSNNVDNKGIKVVMNYEVASVNGNVLTIKVSGTTKGSTTMEAQGRSADITLDMTVNGTFNADAVTGFIKQSEITTKGTTSFDAGGQSMEIPSTVKITSVIE